MLSNLSLQLINNFFHVNITSFAVYLQFNVPILSGRYLEQHF